jgi:S1-C subfamily serine protease
MTNQRSSALLAALIGAVVGAVFALAVGAGVLIATGALDDDDNNDRGAAPIASPSTSPRSPQRVAAGAIGSIYARTAPGVVYIQARGVESSRESPFGPPQPRRGGVATGSGFVLDRDGYIVTNAHVVEGADQVRVQFVNEDDPVEARVVGTDASTDVALLKVNPDDSKLRPIPLGDSDDVGVGEPAIAIGNPFGLERTITTGIVSALEREIEAPNGFSIPEVIQTDAAINPGNSGGPLLDGRGRVIGINSQIASRSGANSGIGFAVPVNAVKRVIPALRDDGEVHRAYLGISSGNVTPDLARRLNLPTDDGALIGEVVPGGPAERAGLRAAQVTTRDGRAASGDLIVAVDGKRVAEASDVGNAIADMKPGDEIRLRIVRNGDERTVTVTLGERPTRAPGG